MQDKAIQQAIKRKFYKNDRWMLVLWIMILYSVVNVYDWPQTTNIQFIERLGILLYLFLTITFAAQFKGYWLKLLLISQGIIALWSLYAFNSQVLSFISPIPAMLFEEMLLGKRISDLPVITIVYTLFALAIIFFNNEIKLMSILLILQALLGLALSVRIVRMNLFSLVKQTEEIVQTNIKLKQANQQIADLTEEKVHRQMARDLHDTLTQDLVGINMRLTVINQLMAAEKLTKAKSLVKQTQKMTEISIKQSRRLIREYRNYNAEKEKVALKRATINTIDIIEKDYALTTIFTINKDIEFSMAMMTDVQRVIGEALMNVVKHGKTDQARLNIIVSDNQLTVEISNHGQPWNPATKLANHFGIKNMRERAAKYNGDVVFEPLEKGVKVIATFDLKEEK